eukprot:CAMPEP_0202897686 /NCGR_PEP_ID=MMETSP1392-20130828/6387_1 /ASSEMBLY_ACC=CAM_ASM_000868 /TAXON_ID=225041 /ORGANISM="Chlamydomonas chlamydogama, Strain SAG 11-48b" /LENGTH=102 /DNA_ID=CAMNT_0049583385 /DNA_START=894 /DNA_END=1199 /DNA_ORIENTATION=+
MGVQHLQPQPQGQRQPVMRAQLRQLSGSLVQLRDQVRVAPADEVLHQLALTPGQYPCHRRGQLQVMCCCHQGGVAPSVLLYVVQRRVKEAALQLPGLRTLPA